MEEEINATPAPDENQAQMEKRAKKRVHFRIHLFIYLIVIAFFWLLWFFLFKPNQTGESSVFLKLCWAITLFWALIVFTHYMFAIRWNRSAVEKEVSRLKKREKQLKEKMEQLKENIKEKENNQPSN
ncbi:MAG: 2TM domain-containing protein [Bacteroidales bacterium]|nr:2TM domain-containing protein [Bacteroidales bacterium]